MLVDITTKIRSQCFITDIELMSVSCDVIHQRILNASVIRTNIYDTTEEFFDDLSDGIYYIEYLNNAAMNVSISYLIVSKDKFYGYEPNDDERNTNDYIIDKICKDFDFETMLYYALL